MDKDTTKSTFNEVLNQLSFEIFVPLLKKLVLTGMLRNCLQPSCSTSCLLPRLPKLNP